MPKIDQLVDITVGHPRFEFLGRFSGLSSDTFGLERSRKNCFCYSYWELSLQSNVIWLEECRIHVSEDDDEDV